ncbi:phage minor head protein [Streptomyces sp. NPDC059278]|uniref:phage minor head protein n=1 Tax=Streptomyces sp. NPDC059278 TaxID=3346801 RepID=UPI0036958F64
MPLDDPWLSSRMAEYAHVRRAENALHPAVREAVKDFLAQTGRALLGSQGAATLTAAPDNDADGPDLTRFPDDNAWQRAVDNHIRPAARRLFDGAYYRLVDARESAQNNRRAAGEYLSGLGQRLSGFRASVWERLRRTVNQGTEAGETPAQLRARVAQLMTLEDWDGAVMTMTRTETMTALNAGAYAGAFDEQERTGEPWEKRWQATHDQRVRHTHATADGQVRPLHDPFEVGGSPLQFPGDPRGPAGEVINCRCAARYAPAQDPTLTAASTGEDPAMATPTVTTEAPGPVQVSPSGRWRGVLGFMDEWSADQRMLAAPTDGVRSRPLPLPLLVQGALASGHDGGELGVGVIDRVWTDGNAVWGEGRFDMEDPIGQQLARKVGLGFIRFVSLDVDDATAQQVLVDADGNVVTDGDPTDQTLGIGDVYSGWRVMGATLLAHPAFPNAAIALADDSGQTLTAAAFAEIVGYNPDWGCVKPNGDTWEAADCADQEAVPANATGDGPFDPEPHDQAPESDPGSLADAPVPQAADTDAQDAQDPPSDIAADAEDAAEELDPNEDDPEVGCVTQTEDGSWAPADCDTEGAVPANAEGNGPFDQAQMGTTSTEELAVTEDGTPEGCEPCQAVTITASATGSLAPGWTPPADWFQQPTGNGGAHSIRVDVETGRVSGYLAAWGSCHVGYKNRCVPPPHSTTDYAYFNIRPVKTNNGTVYCGLLTMGTGHASLSASANSALAHYDNTGTQAAVVRVGEDNHGIWAVGAVLPFLTEADRLRLSLASFSGDWREVRGGAELIAALAVNSPGFPLAAKKTGADNQTYALVAAGALQPEPPHPTQPEPHPAPAEVDLDALAAKVILGINKQQELKERTAAAADTLTALRKDTHARTQAATARRIELARGKVVRVQRPKAGEPPLELIGRGALPTPSTQDIGLARNWVDEQGGLPPYIKRISKHLEDKGMDTGRAIATAVNAAKKMCASGDLNWPGIQQVNPGSKAEACSAVARWEEMKKAARAS